VIPGVSPDWAMLAYKVLRIGVVAMAAVVVYPYIPGSDTEAFKGIGIFAGALFTLGASGMAGNILGGLALTFAGTFHVGDRVKIGEVVGDVVQTTLMLTRVRSIRNEIVTIPNSTILAGHIVNYSTEARGRGLVLVTEVTIGYDAPWRKVHELLIEAARRTPEVLATPAPFVLQHSLNDYHVSYEIWAYTANATDMFLTYGALHQNIQDSFNEGGIEILSPGYASLRDGNTTTIPASYRDGRYAPPPFRVRVSDPAGRGDGT
jgi:small-conductance mechanosensitive channel